MDSKSVNFNTFPQPDVVTNTHNTETGFSKDGKPVNYNWWDARARDEKKLTTEETEVIYNCGGLRYLRTCGKERGFARIQGRSVSEKHYYDCVPNCVCGRN